MENNNVFGGNIMDYLMVSKETLLELYKFCKGYLSDGEFECSYDVEKVSDFIDNIVRPYLDLNNAIETEITYKVMLDVSYEDEQFIGEYPTKHEAVKAAKQYMLDMIADDAEEYNMSVAKTTIEETPHGDNLVITFDVDYDDDDEGWNRYITMEVIKVEKVKEV